MAGQVVALEPFATEVKGRDFMVHDGDVFPADHPVVKGRKHLFGPVRPTTRATGAYLPARTSWSAVVPPAAFTEI